MGQPKGKAPWGDGARGAALSWTAYALLRLCSLLAAMEVAVLTWPILSGQVAPGLLTWGKAGPLQAGLPELSPSGLELLRRCEDRLREMSTREAHPGHAAGVTRESSRPAAMADVGAGDRARGRSLGEGVARTWFRWNVSGLPPSPFHSDLGWVETLGMGTHQARVGARTCVTVAVMTHAGHLFDRGCLQRVAFMANMSSVEPEEGRTGRMDKTIRLAGEVTYMPHMSMHRVCYTAPQPGVYRLHIAPIFTNAFHLMSTRDAALSEGYANYSMAVNSLVHVAGPKGFSLSRARRKLPACTLETLTASKAEGFWVGDEWRPAACRVKQMEPSEMVKCLHGKSVLFLGDSEMRYTYGVLQTFMSVRSRVDFLQWLENHSWHSGSILEGIGVPRATKDRDPSSKVGTPVMRKAHYNLSSGDSCFYGGRWDGFGRQNVRYTAPPRGANRGDPRFVTLVNGTLTYVSFFLPSKPLFTRWMLDGSLTDGVTARPGPFDMVLEAAELHSVSFYDSSIEYSNALNNSYIPKLKVLCPRPRCTHVSFGPWVGNEVRKPKTYVQGSNNVRQLAFEEAAYRVFPEQGLPYMLPMWSLTAPQRGGRHAVDSVHYRAPVTLAMLDLVFGSLCHTSTGRLL